MGEFLREHQAIAAPIIEWGGLFLLLLIIFSPFIIIRHRYFKPTHWRHVVGAYIGSFFIYSVLLFNSAFDHWMIFNFFNTVELSNAHFRANFKALILAILVYPLFVFYCAKLLYGPYNLKRFLCSTFISVVFLITLLIAFIGVMIYGLGQASMNF